MALSLPRIDCIYSFSLEGGPRRQKVGMRVEQTARCLSGCAAPLRLGAPPTLSRQGRGKYSYSACCDRKLVLAPGSILAAIELV